MRIAARLAVVAAMLISASESRGADPSNPLASTPLEARRRLEVRTNASWSGAKLRNVAYGLGQNAGVGVLVDRRIDSELTLEVSFADVAFAEVFQTVAARHGAAVSFFGPVVYVGPPEAAARLRTVALVRQGELDSLPADLRAACAMRRPLAWNELSEPRQMVEQLVAEAGLRLDNAAAIPHDLWPAVALPSLTWVERMTLVLNSFDLTFRIDGQAKSLKLERIVGPTVATRTFAAGPNADETLRRWQALAPGAQLRREADQIIVTGQAEDFDRITGVAAKPAVGAKQPPAAGIRVYTLKVQDVPFGEFIKVLRDTHGLKIRIDEAAIRAAGISLDKRTQVSVQKATLVEMLEQAAAPLGLTARQVGDEVEIVPRK